MALGDAVTYAENTQNNFLELSTDFNLFILDYKIN